MLKSCSRLRGSVMMVSIILWWRSTIAWNSSFHASSPFCASTDVAMSLSVMPPNALTTTMMGCSCASFSTIAFRLRILSTEPTEVPPNFNTFISFCSVVNVSIPGRRLCFDADVFRNAVRLACVGSSLRARFNATPWSSSASSDSVSTVSLTIKLLGCGDKITKNVLKTLRFL